LPQLPIGVEDDYHLFLAWKDSKNHCHSCGRETNFRLFDGFHRFINWCCTECYDEKYSPKRKKA